MEKQSQGVSRTPTIVDEHLREMPRAHLKMILLKIQDRLNETPEDPRLIGAMDKIVNILGDDISEKPPFPVTAMRLAMMMDRLGQYDLADLLDDIAWGF